MFIATLAVLVGLTGLPNFDPGARVAAAPVGGIGTDGRGIGAGPLPANSVAASSSAGAIERFATVALAPNHPGALSGQAAWLAYDPADQSFFIAVPPDLVEVVPGDFSYNPIVLATIPVGAGPFGVAYDNATGDVFITNSGSANVSVINATSMRWVASVPVGSGPMGVAYDPVNRDVYVANNGSNNVSVISDTRLAVVATVAVGDTPLGVAVDPSSGEVFVANHGSSNVSVISGATNGLVTSVAVPSGPYGVAVDPTLHQVFVTDETAVNISAISEASETVIANISMPPTYGGFRLDLQGLDFDSGNGLVYAGAGTSAVVIILPSNDSVLAELNFDPAGVAYDPDTGDICVTNAANATFECAVFSHPALGGPYTVQFSESGLPSATPWYVTLDSTTGTSNGTAISLRMPNGSFPFSVQEAFGFSVYYPNPSTGLVAVVGANVTVPITFATGTYLVDVVESGLPARTAWTAALGGMTSTSTTATNGFNVSNGTYELAVGEVANYTASPVTSAVTVNGRSLVLTIVYAAPLAPRFPVTFTESGLAAGTPWGVTLDLTNLTTTASSLVFNASNGTYSYQAGATGYVTQPAYGQITVEGRAVNQTVNFTSTRAWTITFQETGLVAGTDWGVLIGSEAQSSTTATLNFSRLNGTYGFLVLPVSGYVAASPGSLVVHGADQVVSVRFSPQLYPIVFLELGLAAGANWSVTVVDTATGYNQTLNSTTSSIIFFLPNGTYTFTFTLPAGYTGTARSTTITVAGRAGTAATVSAGQPPAGGSSGSPHPAGSTATFLNVGLAVGVIVLLVALALVLRRRRPPASDGEPRAG